MDFLNFALVTLGCAVVLIGTPFVLMLAEYLLTRLAAILGRQGALLLKWQQKPYAWLSEIRVRQVERQAEVWMREAIGPETVSDRVTKDEALPNRTSVSR